MPELANKSGENLPKIDAEMRKPVYAPDLTSTSQECLKAPASISWNAMKKVDQEYAACTRKTLSQSPSTFRGSAAALNSIVPVRWRDHDGDARAGIRSDRNRADHG